MLSPHDNQLLAQTGPGTPMGELFRRFWLPVLLADELPAPDCPPVAIRILGEDLVAFRDSNGAIGVLEAYCAHRHAHLFWGRNEEAGLRCTYHGWKFDSTGACVDMPNEPIDSNFKAKVRLTAYPAREMGGLVWAYLGPPELMPRELPRFEGAGLPAEQWHVSKELQLSNWAQAVEGGIDSSHISFLHRSLESLRAGRQAAPELASGTMVDGRLHQVLAAYDRSPQFFVEEADFGLWIGARRDAGDTSFYWRLTPFLVPSYTIIPGGGAGRGGHCWVPMDDDHCWVFNLGWSAESRQPRGEGGGLEDDVRRDLARWDLATSHTFMPERNRDNSYRIDREAQRTQSFTGIESIRAQDRSIQESMGTTVPRWKEHLGTTDLAIIQFRRVMLRLARDLLEGNEPPQPANPELYDVISTAVVLDRSLPWLEGTRDFVRGRSLRDTQTAAAQ